LGRYAWGGDFYPTIAEATGVPLPKNQKMDGQSLMPVLQGKTQKPRTLYWHYPHYGNQGGGPASCIMQGDYKLIHWYDDDRWELYNLQTYREEKNDLFKKESMLAGKMRKDLEKWFKKMGAKFPTKNQNYKTS
jgi:arylsulfatase A-like enzyme